MITAHTVCPVYHCQVINDKKKLLPGWSMHTLTHTYIEGQYQWLGNNDTDYSDGAAYVIGSH